MRSLRASSGLIALAVSSCASPPVITDPEVAGVDTVEIHGKNFGTEGSIVFEDGVTVPSTKHGTIWTDTRIQIALPARFAPLHVHNDGGDSNSVGLTSFALTTTAIPATAGTNARPLAIAIAGQEWFINQEFHRDLQHGVVSDGFGAASVDAALSPPRPPDPGPFAAYFPTLCLDGHCVNDADARTQTSVLGEDIIVDSLGRVWYSEGGGLLYEQRASTNDPSKQVMVFPNHSRIIMFDPSSSSYRVYNVPGDRNEVIGLAWDAVASKLWFCEGGRVGGNRLGRLDPELAKFDTTSPSFDFSTDADATGYDFFDVPLAKSFPAMPLLDIDGHVWFTMYLGNAIGRLEPTTKHVDILPLPKPRATKGPAAIFATGGPWRIVSADDGRSVVFGEQYDFEITKLDVTLVRANVKQCSSLDVFGVNPCMHSIALEDPNKAVDGALLHSIAVGPQQRIWFTEMGAKPDHSDDRIGFITPDFAHVIELSPGQNFGGPNGIAFTAKAGGPFFAQFNGEAIGAMTPFVDDCPIC